MPSMELYSRAAVERAMKVPEVILRAVAKKIRWWQAAEIIGISDRQVRSAGFRMPSLSRRTIPNWGQIDYLRNGKRRILFAIPIIARGHY